MRVRREKRVRMMRKMGHTRPGGGWRLMVKGKGVVCEKGGLMKQRVV